jgi:hypothetical protein
MQDIARHLQMLKHISEQQKKNMHIDRVQTRDMIMLLMKQTQNRTGDYASCMRPEKLMEILYQLL